MLKNVIQWSTARLLLNGATRSEVRRCLCASLTIKAKENAALGESELEPANRRYGNPFAQTTPTTLTDNTTTESEEQRDKRLKVLQLEADIAHQEGRRVPALEFFKDHHWAHVLSLPTKSARIKYYGFLWQIEMKKESEKRKKEQRAEDTERRLADLRKEREENTHIIYGLGHTSMFLRIYDTTINHWQNNRLTRAMQFAPKMVFDCSYDTYMNNRESSNAAKQLMLSFAENRANDEPFDLHYCNANLAGRCMQGLQRFIPTMHNPEFPMNVHTQCFTELFPKSQLVYLTPHCREDLVTYNPDDVYIIGAMVDTVNNEPLSLAKAKRLGLRMARLPLDRYLQWGSGSGKSLTLNQMINIMLDIKKTGDWDTALRHVPRRKVVDLGTEQYERRQAFNRRANQLNVRIDHLIKLGNDQNESTAIERPRKVRQHKEGLEFDLQSWATGKRKTTKRNKFDDGA
ncbi:mitochondrial ribonuclease P protein 1 homolog [Drosophila hydei]|uniref:RNA (guanine-9-)-methyltransferase domain-containing protein 1 n=1 Tax=Drosophila hydei TaxID=7224 RepID=A0A6J1M7H7_DROHY|nr:mitochondrial ribonuclease P protein 1 homolog [Drosophila hydei]XP_023175148.2 mitochondrial ribonuclease P protein 1 homolog [Drosophila hydei]